MNHIGFREADKESLKIIKSKNLKKKKEIFLILSFISEGFLPSLCNFLDSLKISLISNT